MIKISKVSKYIQFNLDKLGIYRMDDKEYLKILYEIVMGKRLELDNPQTFNEKLQWLKLYDRNDEYTKMVDKYEVKKYVDIEKVEGLLEKYDDISNCQNRNEVKLILIPLVFYKFIKQYREMLNFQYDI